MPVKLFLTVAIFIFLSNTIYSQKPKLIGVSSPDGKIAISISIGEELSWSVQHGSDQVLAPSILAVHLQNGEVLGKNIKKPSFKTQTVNRSIPAIAYKKKTITDH
jgi:alpha-glucosidase